MRCSYLRMNSFMAQASSPVGCNRTGNDLTNDKVEMKDFRKLMVWEKAHQLTLSIYQVTAAFPSEETYGLTSQMRRAASSIPSNIAEGCGRQGDAELSRFCTIARGSASELEYQILLSRDLKLTPSDDYERLTQQT